MTQMFGYAFLALLTGSTWLALLGGSRRFLVALGGMALSVVLLLVAFISAWWS